MSSSEEDSSSDRELTHEIVTWGSVMCKPFLPSWQKMFFHDHRSLPRNPITPPNLAIQKQTVEVIFYMCHLLELPLPVNFLAADIFEDFISKHIVYLFTGLAEKVDSKNFSHYWPDIEQRISNQLLLRILTCVQLASKVVFSGKIVTNTQIRSIISSLTGDQLELCSIVASELRVFKTLGFRVSLFSALDVMEQLLEVCVQPTDNIRKEHELLYNTCVDTLKLAYIHNLQLREGLNLPVDISTWQLTLLTSSAVLLAGYSLCRGERSARLIARELVTHANCEHKHLTNMTHNILTLVKQ